MVLFFSEEKSSLGICGRLMTANNKELKLSCEVKAFYDKDTGTLTYVVYHSKTKDAIIIDSLLNYEASSSRISYHSLEEVLDFVLKKELSLHSVLETHAHADHIAGAAEIKKRFPHIKIGIGKQITQTQETFCEVYNIKDLNTRGVPFDFFLEEEKVLELGALKIKTLFTPGHTPACCSYLIENLLFTGDALFMPDFGTGRCDFPGGSAEKLYESIQKLYKLPEETRVFVGHDYCPQGRDLRYETTIKESKKRNIHLHEKTSKQEFVAFRNERDKTLSPPKLLLPSMQLNIDGGRIPVAENNGVSYFKIPIYS